jgi:hypothetical protein
MRKVSLLFYPLKRSAVIEDGDLLELLVINFDELLSREIYFPQSTTDDEIARKIDELRAFQVVHIDTYRIE